MSTREKIIQYFLDIARRIPGVRVYRDYPIPLTREDVPAIVISFVSDINIEVNNAMLKRELTLSVDVYLREPDGGHSYADQIMCSFHREIAKDESLGKIAVSTYLGDVEYEHHGADIDVIYATNTYKVTYFVSRKDLEG